MAAAQKKDGKEKPLDKMTVKELKEIALQLPEMKGVHGMNKQDLVVGIKKARGIDVNAKKSTGGSVKEYKKKINVLKKKHVAALEADDARMAGILKSRIIRLKKLTRRAA